MLYSLWAFMAYSRVNFTFTFSWHQVSAAK